MKFDPTQDTYLEFREKIRKDPSGVVAIVGAGLSFPAGLPLWSELKTALLHDLRKAVPNLPHGEQAGRTAQLDRIESSARYWQDFEEIENLSGRTDFRERVMQRLTPASGRDIPLAYSLLWRLGIKGIVTFNLDAFSINSYAKEFGRVVDHASGVEDHKYGRFLGSTEKFVLHAHGQLKDPNSWVFSANQRTRILDNHGYRDFFKALLAAKTVVILGFQPEDFSFEYLLQDAIGSKGPNGIPHYVICANPSPATAAWLDGWGFRKIVYQPTNKYHPEIGQILSGICEYLPKESPVPSSFAGKAEKLDGLDGDAELSKLPVEQSRRLLNGVMATLISSDVSEEAKREDTRKIFKTYRGTIHKCWLVDEFEPHNGLFEYTVEERIGKGAFGNVYRAHDKDGAVCVLKILLDECTRDVEFLECFRRGANSMKILTQKSVNGMVPFRTAYEIPACIVMDYVDGKTLEEAVSDTWVKRLLPSLDVIVKTAEIVHSGHQLPEQVLHRDLKPSNVMLRGLEYDQDEPEVVVLDFDLSWHEGAQGLSVIQGARQQGYAAPEQTRKTEGVSNRHTAVDSFGLGMVAFFIIVGRHPIANEQEFGNFPNTIREAAEERLHANTGWRVFAEEIAGLIFQATRTEQKERAGFGDLLASFRELRDIAKSGKMGVHNPLFLREIAYRMGMKREQLDLKDFGREIDFAASKKTVSLKLISNGGQMGIYFSVHRPLKESDDRKEAGKYLKARAEKAAGILRTNHGRDVFSEYESGSCSVGGSFYVSDPSASRAQSLADTFYSVLAEMEFQHG